MKPEILKSLLVDRELGELTPEVVELLNAYLDHVPEARAEAQATARTVETARETIRRFPELAVTPATTPSSRSEPIRSWFVPSLAYAAAAMAVAAVAGWIGFRTGISETHRDKTAIVARATDHRFEGLWTQYRVVYDSGHSFVVAQQR
ncbi:MAG TPA: hypothetical protein VL171_16395 [Verrucomicrobiae bacterium]|nr:hypothetical protein [Verrucomicrobiae bacterium]